MSDNLLVEINLAGQSALLLPQKAIYLVESRTLVVADVHVGKGASFRSRSFFAPDGVTSRDLSILTETMLKLGARRLLILGDLVHAQDGLTKEEVSIFDDFRQSHLDVEMVLVLGNHDKRARLPASWRLMQVKGDLKEGPFLFAHEYEAKSHSPKITAVDDPYVLSGHIHPSVVLYGKGKQRERLPCFWVRHKYTVLPSFGVFTGSFTIKPTKLDKVYVVARDVVIPVTP